MEQNALPNQTSNTEAHLPSNKIDVKLIIIGVVLLLLVASLSYFLGTKSQQTLSIAPTPTIMVPTQIITISPLPTQHLEVNTESNWVTYTSQDLHFSILYMNNFTPVDLQAKSQGYMEFIRKAPGERALAHISVARNDAKLSPQDWLNQAQQFKASLPKDVNISDIEINGVRGIRLDNIGGPPGYADYMAIFTTDKYVAILNFAPQPSEARLTDVMLTEFKFLD